MLFCRFIVALTLLFFSACSAHVLSQTTVSASVKDTSVNGFDGLNVEIAAPFRFQDYDFGFKYALSNNLKKAPESVYVRKVFETPANGVLDVGAEYVVEGNTGKVATSWSNKDLALRVGMVGDSKNLLTGVSLSKTGLVMGNELFAAASFNVPKQAVHASASYSIDDTIVSLQGDSKNLDPVLSVTRRLDVANEVTPTISLKTGKMSYNWRRKWFGGSLSTTVHPNSDDKKVELEWRDEGVNGQWITRAEIPLEDATKVKLSVSRDWRQ